MSKQVRYTLLVLTLLVLLTVGWIATVSAGRPAARASRPLQQQTLPMIEFLGEGPGIFELEPPLFFLVKGVPGNVYTGQEGPTYEAQDRERVWSIDVVPEGGVAVYDDEVILGAVEPGCPVEYVQIDDDLDERINRFYLDGVEIHVAEQGMVTYGAFTITEPGELTLFAEDSVGLIILVCPEGPQPTDTPVPTETPIPTETPVPTNTPKPKDKDKDKQPSPTQTPVPPPPTPVPTDTPAAVLLPESGASSNTGDLLGPGLIWLLLTALLAGMGGLGLWRSWR